MLRVATMRKLEKMVELIYNYGMECFGAVEKRKTTLTKSRRQKKFIA